MKFTLFTFAAYLIGSIPASASFISTNVFNAGTTQGSGNAGEVVTLGSGQDFAQAVTDYGANHAQTSSSTYQNYSQASSDWRIDFTLGGNGLGPGAFVTLAVTYSYDFTLTAFSGFGSPSTGYNVSAAYGIAGNNADQGHLFEVFNVSASSNADGSLEQCKTKVPGGATPQECLGSYAGSGTITETANWHIGQNRIETEITAGSAIGAVDAYNTGLITGIVVPDGITWTYDAGITGNPLNFQNASTAAPEPATFAIFGLGLAVLCAARLPRKLNLTPTRRAQ